MNWLDYLLTGAGIGTALAAAIAFFKLLGTGIAWLMERDDKRKTSLTARLDAMETKVNDLNAKMIIVGKALAEAVAELRHHAPGSDGLARYEKALRLAFPVFDASLDLAVMATQIDKKNGKG